MSPNGLSSALYLEVTKANVQREMLSWHASSIAQCPRAQYFHRLGVGTQAQATGAKMLRWQAGHNFESAIRPYLKKLFPNLKSNERLYSKELDLTGEYDNYDPDSSQLIEIKTVGPRAVLNKKVADDRYHLRDMQPYLAHEWQQHAYVLLLKGTGLEVKQITYLYITLEGLIVPYMTAVRQETLLAVKERLEALNYAWEHQVPPGCQCHSEDPLWGSATQFCDYRNPEGCCDLKLIKKEALSA